MRRRISATLMGILLVLGLAAPASADPGCQVFGNLVAQLAQTEPRGFHDVVPGWAQSGEMAAMVDYFKTVCSL